MAKFKIKNTEVYGLQESVIASGYPMSKDTNIVYYSQKRADKLSKAPSGSGHDCFLKGITVQADITAPQYWWMQFQRYHFADIISSQSKMHRITKMDIEEQCNKHVDKTIINILKNKIESYKVPQTKPQKEWCFKNIIANVPMGLMLTARITTNYLQLKTVYKQRKGHKLEEWHDFCNWVEGLRMSNLITGLE